MRAFGGVRLTNTTTETAKVLGFLQSL